MVVSLLYLKISLSKLYIMDLPGPPFGRCLRRQGRPQPAGVLRRRGGGQQGQPAGEVGHRPPDQHGDVRQEGRLPWQIQG